MEPNYKIRAAALSDIDPVYSFISHLEERRFDLEGFKERFLDNLDREDVIYLVCVNDHDEPIGFISCHGQSLLHYEKKLFEIQEMYVSRNYREKGIGKALFTALQEKLVRMDREGLEVSMHVKRSDARKFFSKLGFQSTHVKFVKTV